MKRTNATTKQGLLLGQSLSSVADGTTHGADAQLAARGVDQHFGRVEYTHGQMRSLRMPTRTPPTLLSTFTTAIAIGVVLGCGSDDRQAMTPDSGNPSGGAGGSGGSAGSSGFGGSGGSGGGANTTGGSGGDAGSNAMLSLVGPRRIALKRGVMCRIDAGGVLACEKPDGLREIVPGEFVDLAQDPYGFVAIRSDGVAVDLEAEWSSPDDVLTGCDSLEACDEIRPSHGKLVSVSTDGATGCGALDDGTVECWGPNALAEPPDGPIVRVAWESLTGLCFITEAGQARCVSDGVSSDLPGGVIAEGVVQIGIGGTESALALRSTGEVIARSSAHEPVEMLPRLRFFDTGSLTGITIAGEIASANDALSRIEPPAGPFVEVSGDGSEACALREDGTHVCWGGDWGNGSDSERCGLHRLGLRGTVAGQTIEYGEPIGFDNHLISDHVWHIDANDNYDSFVLRSPDAISSPYSSQYEPGSTFQVADSAFLLSDGGVRPRVYCAGAGSSASKVDDELALDLENVIALGVCGDNPIEGEYSSCTDVGCEVTSTFEGVMATSRVKFSTTGQAAGVSSTLTAYEDGTVIRSVSSGSRGYAYVFTPPDGPFAGAVYCSGNVDSSDTYAPLSKVGSCAGATSADTLEGCIRN